MSFRENRVLLHAPTSNDAPLTAKFLTQAGLVVRICAEVQDFFDEDVSECGAILISEEALGDISMPFLLKALSDQPPWSDIPVIIITTGGEANRMRLQRLAIFGSGGNVSLLERPFRRGTLISTVEAALRARKRQFEVRNLVQALQESENKLSRLAYQREAQARLFDTTLSSITDLAYTFDLEGNWVYANKPLLELWGKSLAEISGKSSLELGYPVELADRLKSQVKEVVQTRKPIRGETYFTDAKGVADYHEYIFSPVLAADGSVSAVCGTTRLATERKRQEATAESHRRVMQLIAEDAPLELTLSELVRGIELGSSTKVYASVMLLDADGIHLRSGAAPSLPAEFTKAFDGLVIGPTAGCCGKAAFLKTPVHVADIASDPLWAAHKELALSQGLRACWSVPVVSTSGNVLGTFAIYHLEPREATSEDLMLEAMAARTASIAIDRKRSDAAVRESARRYSQLVHTLPAAVYTTDAQGRVALYNEAAVALWGREPEVGKDLWRDFIQTFNPDGSVLASEDWPMSVALREGKMNRGQEILIERPDGSRVNVTPSSDPIFDASGQLIGAVHMLLDITESRRAEEFSRRLAAIVESSEDAIISKNLDGIITSWNHGAERILGYTAEEAIGQWVGMLMSEDIREGEEAKILGRIREGEPIEHYETVRRRKDGTMLEVSLTVSPIKDVRGTIVGASKILRDITFQKRSERELEEAHKKVVAASQAKDDFLAALSHELRTPLNPVLLQASESAEDEQLPDKVRSQFAMIRNNVELEARLIDDLLDITRITHDKLSLNRCLVDGHALLNESLRTVKAEIQLKRITLTRDFAAKQCALNADAVRLQQVFWNVLKNAVKFTPEDGQIIVQTRVDAGANHFVVVVKDTGIGMTAADIAKIFQAFTQAEHDIAGSHRFGGLGLGLAISRKLMDLHKGTISAESDGPGLGSTFTISLPMATIGSTSPISEEGKPSMAGKKKPRMTTGVGVLLVEDHEPTRAALTHMLMRRGYSVSSAGSIAEARRVPITAYALLISDVGLPDGNGLDLMQELSLRIPSLQGIALTGYGMEADVARSRKAGFVAHLTKPVSIQFLEEALDSITFQSNN